MANKNELRAFVEKRHSDYMSRVAHAAMAVCIPDDGIYHGIDGCHRLARECGAAYIDFERMGADADKLMGSTYSGICVIAYGLKPPVDAAQWLAWLREGFNDAKEIYDEENEEDTGADADTGGV